MINRGVWGGFPPRVLALAALVMPASVAHAHIGHVIARGERYLKLDVAGNRARVVVSLTLGAGEGARVLSAADSDRNGQVSEAERDAYLAQWAQGLATEVPVTVDGEARELEWGEPYMDPIGPVRATPVTVEMVARIELDGGRQTVRISDEMVRREVYDRTDVAFDVRDGAELIASGVGRYVERTVPALAYGPDLAVEPVTLTAIVRTPPRQSRVPWVPIAIGAGVLIAISAALAYRRRRVRTT